MTQPSLLLAQRYVAALRKHLKEGSPTSTGPALRIGHRTVAIGLETLDLARIHEQALVTMMLPGCSPEARAETTRRAGVFFSEANAPIEEMHRAKGHPGGGRLRDIEEMLVARTKELATAKGQLQRSIVRRKVMGDAFEKRAKLHRKCLEESLRLQKRLRQLTHRLLAAQEDERKKVSRELENEIAQTLVAINVRLLALKQEAWRQIAGCKEEIARTQHAVVESVRTVRRVARKVRKV